MPALNKPHHTSTSKTIRRILYHTLNQPLKTTLAMDNTIIHRALIKALKAKSKLLHIEKINLINILLIFCTTIKSSYKYYGIPIFQ